MTALNNATVNAGEPDPCHRRRGGADQRDDYQQPHGGGRSAPLRAGPERDVRGEQTGGARSVRRFTAQGVVQTFQGKRAVIGDTSPVAIEAYFRFMQRMDRESIAELYELREVIEVAATVLAARRATDEDKSRAAPGGGEDGPGQRRPGDLRRRGPGVPLGHHRRRPQQVPERGHVRALRCPPCRAGPRGAQPYPLRSTPPGSAGAPAVLEAVEAGDKELAEEAMVAHMISGRGDLKSYVASHFDDPRPPSGSGPSLRTSVLTRRS